MSILHRLAAFSLVILITLPGCSILQAVRGDASPQILYYAAKLDYQAAVIAAGDYAVQCEIIPDERCEKNVGYARTTDDKIAVLFNAGDEVLKGIKEAEEADTLTEEQEKRLMGFTQAARVLLSELVALTTKGMTNGTSGASDNRIDEFDGEDGGDSLPEQSSNRRIPVPEQRPFPS